MYILCSPPVWNPPPCLCSPGNELIRPRGVFLKDIHPVRGTGDRRPRRALGDMLSTAGRDVQLPVHVYSDWPPRDGEWLKLAGGRGCQLLVLLPIREVKDLSW